MDNMLKYFMGNTSKEFHIRELARLAKKSPTTIAKELLALKKQGLLESSRKYNRMFYKADINNPAFRDMKIAYNIKNIRKSGLIEFLSKDNPEAIILFGSARKGDNSERSDIDIALVEPQKEEHNLEPYEKKLGHEIQIICITRKDISNMAVNNKEILNNIANGIVLEGFFELFR
ncbi:MAG: nucleotidyltransferase domain-containing protein [Nanoarchaeota archaeon]|nr:nucleotidyltransferase domain-containing protein [Nanoarchaeota archaeon]